MNASTVHGKKTEKVVYHLNETFINYYTTNFTNTLKYFPLIFSTLYLTEIEMQKNMFFSNHVFYGKNKVFFIEKNSFLMFFFCFFSITGRFLINYSAIRVYL